MNKKRCIVSFFSKGREDYASGAMRLINSVLLNKVNSDIFIWSPDVEKEEEHIKNNNLIRLINRLPKSEKYGKCKPHKEEPYQFKAFCIQEARERGYEQITWMDTSTIIFDNLEHLWKLADQIGVVTFNNQGCPEATWTADDCLETMGCDFEYAKTFFEIEAFCIFWDFTHKDTQPIFDEYMKYCTDGICLHGKSGSTRPEYRAHRHDQSILSYIIRKYYKNVLDYGVWTFGDDTLSGKFHPSVAKIGIANTLEAVMKSKRW